MNDETNDPGFEALVEFLQRERGFDFSGYKRGSLMRRVSRRMQMAGVEDFARYVEYLEVHPEEFAQLFNTILINVTSFFRDEAAWEALRREVIPRILQSKGEHDPVRIWSAGCASGQETYSLAMCFAEAMGREACRERVKVYGTDADDEALNQARLATYSQKEVEGMDPQLLQRHFDPQAGRFVFRADLRRSVIFGHHDIVQDAPISRLDLLVCRNTLMYFNAETQAKILQRFHFALNGDGRGNGYLFLGRAEMLLSHSTLFAPVNLKCRIFAKVAHAGAAPRVRTPLPALGAGNPIPNGSETMPNDRLRELALDETPVARLVIDANGALAVASQKARLLFSINAKDVGRPLHELEISYRPAELRPLIEQAYAERRTVTQTSVERRFPDGERQYLDVIVAPFFDEGQQPLGVGVTFMDVTRYSKMSEELQRSREEIQTANEELQSSNEELQTVNEELRQRTEEMNQLNAFLESVLGGMRAAAVVLNQNLNILIWNRRAEDLWGLRADEVQGRSILNLDIGLPVGELRDVIRPCLSGDSEHHQKVLDAVNRRGRAIRCRVTVSPLLSASKKRDGVIVLMEEEA